VPPSSNSDPQAPCLRLTLVLPVQRPSEGLQKEGITRLRPSFKAVAGSSEPTQTNSHTRWNWHAVLRNSVRPRVRGEPSRAPSRAPSLARWQGDGQETLGQPTCRLPSRTQREPSGVASAACLAGRALDVFPSRRARVPGAPKRCCCCWLSRRAPRPLRGRLPFGSGVLVAPRSCGRGLVLARQRSVGGDSGVPPCEGTALPWEAGGSP